MTETPTPRRGGPLDPFAIAALVLGLVALIRPGFDYFPGLIVGLVAGVLAILFAIGGISARRGRVLMPTLAGVGAFVGFVGGAMALVGLLRVF